MNDYAKFKGKITFRNTIEPETVVDALERFCYEAEIEDQLNRHCFVLFLGGSYCYEADRDAFERIIDEWAPHIRSGFIHFKCDGEVYRYFFNTTQQRWIDQKGRPHYVGNRMIVDEWTDEEDEQAEETASGI